MTRTTTTMPKRIGAFLMALIMCLSLFPVTAFAAEPADNLLTTDESVGFESVQAAEGNDSSDEIVEKIQEEPEEEPEDEELPWKGSKRRGDSRERRRRVW